MKISEKAKERLAGINWLSQLGKPSGADIYQCASLDKFVLSLNGDSWESVTLEARNEITGYLASKNSGLYQQWNLLAVDASQFIEEIIIPSIPEIKGVERRVIYINLQWDLVSYLMEDAFKKVLKKPYFFESLVSVYEKGHMPCGWSGEWPEGHLLVY